MEEETAKWHAAKRSTGMPPGNVAVFCPVAGCARSSTPPEGTELNPLADVATCYDHYGNLHAPDATKTHLCDAPGCDRSYTTKRALNSHKRQHKRKAAGAADAATLRCMCSLPFSTKERLDKHVVLMSVGCGAVSFVAQRRCTDLCAQPAGPAHGRRRDGGPGRCAAHPLLPFSFSFCALSFPFPFPNQPNLLCCRLHADAGAAAGADAAA